MLDAACRVLWATLEDLAPWHHDLLDAAERQRCAAFHREADRARYALGTALARLAAARELGVAADRVPLDRRCSRCGRPHGRPHLHGTGLQLSIAHSGDVVAIALTRVAAAGVDVEELRDFDHAALARRVLSPAEASGVASSADFLRCWARKEALLKATGDGLAAPLGEVDLGSPQQPPRLAAFPGRESVAAVVLDLALVPGYVAAVSVLSSHPPVLRQARAHDLLRAS